MHARRRCALMHPFVKPCVVRRLRLQSNFANREELKSERILTMKSQILPNHSACLLRPARWITIACAVLGLLLNVAKAADSTATVTTDQSDYAPGSTAQINGSGFTPGEVVQLQVLHADGTPSTG